MQAVLLDSLLRLLKGPRASAWAQLLGRAEALPAQAPGLSAQLADSVGLVPAALPWAALLAHAAGIEVGERRWLVLEPLSLKVSPNGIYVVASGDFGQSIETMRTLWAAACTTLASAGLVLEAQPGLRAFAALPQDRSDPDTAPAEDLLGVELQAHLPADRGWRRWLGELQIEWTQHPLHNERVARDALPINSPWFGRASRWCDPARAVPEAYSPDPLVAAWARWAGARSVTLPGPETALIDARADDGAALTWLQRASQSVLLRFSCGQRFLVRRTDRLKFWRRPYPADSAASDALTSGLRSGVAVHGLQQHR